MSALRVTLATWDDDPPIGGQGVVVREQRAALGRRGIDVRTVAGRGTHGIRVPRVTGRAPLDLSLRLWREPALLVDGADVVHAHGGPGGVLLPRRLTVPLVWTAHHTYRQAYRRRDVQRVLGPLEARGYRNAARVLAVSASTADAVRACGVEPSRVEVLHSGVDAARFEAAAVRVERDPLRMLFVGRLEAEKGPLEAVAVMAAVCARRAGASGVVIGRGRLDLAVRAAASAVPGGRVAAVGEVDDGRIAEEYARAAVVVMPSAYEGFGLVALEAFAGGAAVAAHDVTGLRDAVGDGGVLVAPGDLGALTDAVTALLDDPARRADLAAHGRARVVRDHTWDVHVARLEQVYREALRG